jgi:formate/nitrite transporter FocA (FNT family)
MGVDMTKLTWGAFFTGNLLPVTIGNILGGLFVAAAMYAAYKPEKK